MWEMPIRNSDSGRTVYVNNEPWTATRLTVSLLATGRTIFKGTLPHDNGVEDLRKAKEVVSEVERMLKGHYQQIDVDFYRKRRGQYRRQWGYFAAVHGWHAGINLVLDNAKDSAWPVFTDLWNPLDTYPDMESELVIHSTRMRWSEIKRLFIIGKDKRKTGFSFEPPDNVKDDDEFNILDCWNEEFNAASVVGHEGWLKRPIDHKLGHNPAWCNPIDAVPFTTSASDAHGLPRSMPNADDSRWLEFVGQSPMLGYETAYRYMSELANQVADVVEEWSHPIRIAKTRDGRYIELDMTKGNQNIVPLDTVVEIIVPPKFPTDDRAWLAFVGSDIEKASYPRAAYGTSSPAEAAAAMEMVRNSSSYIINPLIEQLGLNLEVSGNSILRQLDAKKRQYSRPRAVRSTNKTGQAVYQYVNLSELPDGVYVTATIKGAGLPRDKFQALAVVTQALNSPNPPLPYETLMDEYLDMDDPPGEIAKLFYERMSNSKQAYELASPLITLYEYADRYRAKGTPRANDLAEAFSAMAQQMVLKMKSDLTQSQGAAAGAPPAGPPPLAPGGQAGPPGAGQLQGEAQVAGQSPVGAPVAGVEQAPTGPAVGRGAEMLLAQQLAAGGV